MAVLADGGSGEEPIPTTSRRCGLLFVIYAVGSRKCKNFTLFKLVFK
jgi:hypothetical protein